MNTAWSLLHRAHIAHLTSVTDDVLTPLFSFSWTNSLVRRVNKIMMMMEEKGAWKEIKATGIFVAIEDDDNDEWNDRLRLKTYFQFTSPLQSKITVAQHIQSERDWSFSFQIAKLTTAVNRAALFFLPLVAIECKYLLNSKIKLN